MVSHQPDNAGLMVADTIQALVLLVVHALDRHGQAQYSAFACSTPKKHKTGASTQKGVLQDPLVGPSTHAKHRRVMHPGQKHDVADCAVVDTCRQYLEAVRPVFDNTPTLEVFFVSNAVGRCSFTLCGVWSPEPMLAAYLPPQDGIVGASIFQVARGHQAGAATNYNTVCNYGRIGCV